jgi:hypothetical protein
MPEFVWLKFWFVKLPTYALVAWQSGMYAYAITVYAYAITVYAYAITLYAYARGTDDLGSKLPRVYGRIKLTGMILT